MKPLGIGSHLRALVRLVPYLAFTGALIPLQAAAVALGVGLRTALPVWYHGHCLRLLGFRVTVKGGRSPVRPTLYVVNHASYFDIMVLGSLIPGSFVAKAEVAGWPFFGTLAKLQRTVFVDRQRHRAAEHRDQLQSRLEAGDNLILFPEGTSNDGGRVLPFRSALFSVAEREVNGAPVTVQPVSIAYTRLDSIPLGRFFRPFFAWYGDMALAPHLWQAIGLGKVEVVVEFHPTMSVAELGNRRRLAATARERVAAGVEQALVGRAA